MSTENNTPLNPAVIQTMIDTLESAVAHSNFKGEDDLLEAMTKLIACLAQTIGHVAGADVPSDLDLSPPEWQYNVLWHLREELRVISDAVYEQGEEAYKRIDLKQAYMRLDLVG